MNFNNTSTEGYKRTSPDRNRNFNFIPSGKITMQGVDKPLTLIPVLNGKPMFDKKVTANPGDPDFDFGEVDGVLELPMAQSQYGTIGSGYQRPWELYDNGMQNRNYQSNLNTPPLQADNGFSFDPMQSFNPNVQKEFNPIEYASETPMQREQRMIAEANKRQAEANPDASKKNQGFMGAINPYGGFNLDNSSVYLGASIANKNPFGIASAGAKVGLGVLRNVFSGIGATKRFNEATLDQQEQLRKEAEEKDLLWNYQKGGVLLTQSAIVGDPNNPNPSAEVEKGEYLQTPDGQVVEVMGKKHSEGGELITAPASTKVISDYVKIGAPLAKFFKKEFGINVVAGSTFATVIDRFKRKIGLDKVIDEEASLIAKISDQDETKNQTVKDLNLDVLSKKINEVYARKAPLDEELSKFTNLVFEKQETKKGVDDSKYEMQEGGEVQESNMQAQLEQALQQLAQSQGISMEELMTQISQLPPEEQEAFIQELVGTGSPIPNSEEGGDLEQIIMAYSQLSGQDPQQIAESLANLTEEELDQAVNQMISELQNATNEQV